MSTEQDNRAALAQPSPAVVQLSGSRERRVYIAGPMTGYKDFNFPAFNAQAEALRGLGYHVENPAEHGIVHGAEWQDYLRYDIGRLSTCEAIFLLPGWSKSKGAALEAHIAKALGMTFIHHADAEHEQPSPAPELERSGRKLGMTALINEAKVLMAERDAAQARLAELEAHCIRLGQGDAERYWENRWREDSARLVELERKLEEEEGSHLETIKQRDHAEHWADELAKAIAEHLDVDIGEHSNLNNPWNEALVSMQQPVVQAGQVPEGWSGWATQCQGRIPRLHGSRELAELNWYPEEGQALLRVMEVERIDAAPQPAKGVDHE